MKEALTLALEALERGETKLRWEAITAIKEALTQPNSVHDYGPLCEDIAAWTQRRKSNAEERNFCPRCGKRLGLDSIHTCTPPQIAAGPKAFYGFPKGSVSTSNAGGKCVTAGETAPIDPNQWAFDRGLESS